MKQKLWNKQSEVRYERSVMAAEASEQRITCVNYAWEDTVMIHKNRGQSYAMMPSGLVVV